MGILTTIFGSGIAAPIDAIGKIINECYTSDGEKLDKKIILERIAQKPALLQSEINKIQAAHRSIFVAGARPAMMWICNIGLGYAFIVNPTIQWLTGMPGPQLPTKIMMDLVIGMLGLGALRTVEKLAGKSK